MKALSIKQPWSGLIAAGLKDIENRSWKINFRGRVLIHASASLAHKNIQMLLTRDQSEALHEFRLDAKHLISSETSAIIGEVDIVDCVMNHKSIWAEQSGYHWVLANPVQYEQPILQVNGSLSLWEYNPSDFQKLKETVKAGDDILLWISDKCVDGVWHNYVECRVSVDTVYPFEICCRWSGAKSNFLLLTQALLDSGKVRIKL